MLIAALIFLVVGVVLFFVQKSQKNKAFSLRTARSATVAELEQMAKSIAQEIGGGSWREYVKLTGVIQCDRPLVSQLKQETCVHYRMEVRREYEETVTRKDSDGKSYQATERGSEVLSSNQESTPFTVRDQTGQIEVNPDGAAVETINVLDEFRQEQAIGGLLSFGGFSLALSGVPTQRRTLGYHYSESILPLYRKVLVVGTVSDSGNSLVLQKPTESGKHFIISLKTDEQLTKSADQTAKYAFYGMVACFVIGVILLVLAIIAG
jgi:hypothetical protein